MKFDQLQTYFTKTWKDYKQNSRDVEERSGRTMNASVLSMYSTFSHQCVLPGSWICKK